MNYCKLQLGCLIITLYIAFNYYKEYQRTKKLYKAPIFNLLLFSGIPYLIFDAITAYTVNHLDTVPHWINGFAHMIFLISIDVLVFACYLYILVITNGYPNTPKKRFFTYFPLVLNVLIILATMDTLEYRTGTYSNYSMGLPAYTCYATAGLYILFTLFAYIRRWHYIERHKRASISIFLIALIAVNVYQALNPEALVTSLACTITILGIYINQENPAVRALAHYHNEMVMGFAALVEQRDDNTGGHIRRTSKYVELLARELQKRGYYQNILTKDYIRNLVKAAPMHDIGKISIPDAILQKKGKLTDDEYNIMKTHAKIGGEIIQEIFHNIDDIQYSEIAFQMANFHHEKWNGKGYPQGLEGKDIPLCARIMAIADVFDAVSQDRCYRAALPLDECFNIIKNGMGSDFEPELVKVFLEIRPKVEKIYHRET